MYPDHEAGGRGAGGSWGGDGGVANRPRNLCLREAHMLYEANLLIPLDFRLPG
jgi:hypothetical protein